MGAGSTAGAVKYLARSWVASMDRSLVLVEVTAEGVPPVSTREEEEKIGARRLQDGAQGVLAGIRDRPRWKSGVAVRVVRIARVAQHLRQDPARVACARFERWSNEASISSCR